MTVILVRRDGTLTTTEVVGGDAPEVISATVGTPASAVSFRRCGSAVVNYQFMIYLEDDRAPSPGTQSMNA